MNSAISNLRSHYSQIVKLTLFFYSGGACFLFFLFFLSFSFPCLSCLPLILALSLQTFLCSLSPLLLHVFASFSDETKAEASSQATLYHSGFFFFFGGFGSGCVGCGFGILGQHSAALCGLWVID